jgi:hypothetical protein
MRGDEQRDEMITAGLRSYAEPEEIPEARVVLARVMERAQTIESRRKRIWAWAIPVAACAMAAMVVGFIWVLRVPRIPPIAWTPPAAVVASVKPPLAREVRTPRRTPHRSLLRVAEAQPEPLPKLDVFPSPRPLNSEEQALTTLARPGKTAVAQQVLEAQKHIDDPIDIADLRIRPLNIGDDPVPPTGKEKR